MLDPELKKLLEKLDSEDLKDLAALHGAGSMERQAKVQLKKQAAELAPIAVVVSVLLFGALITALVGLAGGGSLIAGIPLIVLLPVLFVVGLVISVVAAKTR